MARLFAKLALVCMIFQGYQHALYAAAWNMDMVRYRMVPANAAMMPHERQALHAELMRSLTRVADLFEIMPPDSLSVVIHASSRSLIASGLRSDTRAIFHVPTQTIHLLHPRILGASLGTTLYHECLHWGVSRRKDVRCEIPDELLPESLAPSIRSGAIPIAGYPRDLRQFYAAINADLNSNNAPRMRDARQRLHRWGVFLVESKGEKWLARYCASCVSETEAGDLYRRFRSVP
jgi:hypothetical protein